MTRATIPVPSPLILAAQTAEELMTANPISLRESADVSEAITLMTDRAIGATPVIDEAGHPVGVLSRSDILVHDRESFGPLHREPGADMPTLVGDILTPALFAVRTSTTAAEVVKRFCDLSVHQIFVVDEDNVLVGVISALDIVRQLVREG